jgi:predicted nuclease of predicted toxin-antitoxin system
MLRIMTDEMISPKLVEKLAAEGVDALPIRNRGLLKAKDHVLWKRAQDEGRAFVTINVNDFRTLAENTPLHAGLIFIPCGGGRKEQLEYVMAAIKGVKGGHAILPPSLTNKVVTVAEDLSVMIEETVQTSHEAQVKLSG